MKKQNKKYSVLIVEDDIYSSELMQNWVALRNDLELAGTAETGNNAINLFNDYPVDLLLLDINLPDMSGMDILEKLKNRPFVIFTTASEEYAINAFDLGAVDYLVKPINFERFNKSIDRFIEFKSIAAKSSKGFIPVINNSGKYKKSSLTIEKLSEYADILENEIKIKKLFLDHEITLKKLSDIVCIPPHHLSQVINEKFNTNYYAFLNRYRIKEAIVLINDRSNNDKSIIDISLMAGFQSKSVFNKLFKEITGLTPKEYRERNASYNKTDSDE